MSVPISKNLIKNPTNELNSYVCAHNVPHNGSGRSRKVHELSGVISLIKPVFNKDFAGDVVMR